MLKVLFLVILIILLTKPSNARRKKFTKTPPEGVETHIIGGRNVKDDSFSYQVSIELFGDHFCGGSILHPTIILTAGHCLTDYDAPWLKVRAGTFIRQSGGQLIDVKKFIIHPNYTGGNVPFYDVGIIQLSKSLNFSNSNNRISRIKLAKSSYKFRNYEPAIISGWGFTHEDGELSKILQYATIPLLNNGKCEKLIKPNYHKSLFCAGFAKNGSNDACSFDSGGPIVTLWRHQIGIVSWGDGCARADKPGVYANVPFLRRWINKTVKKLLYK